MAIAERILRAYELDVSRGNLKCPFVGVIDAACHTLHLERCLRVVAPGPKVVTALYQIIEYSII